MDLATRSLQSYRRYSDDPFVLFAQIGLIVCMIVGCCLRLYYEEHVGPKCEKEWDEAEAGARWAVAMGDAVPFEMGRQGPPARGQDSGTLMGATGADAESYVAMGDEECAYDRDDRRHQASSTVASANHPDEGRDKDGEGNTSWRAPDAISASTRPLMVPISGVYEGVIGRGPRPGAEFEPRPRHSELNLRFLPGSGGVHYGIFGHGKHLHGGFCHQRRHAESEIISGSYNASTGLAVWQELVDHERACEVHKEHPLHIPRRCRQEATGRTWNSVATHMTVLSHGKFDFKTKTFHGWYYAQVRNGRDYHKEEKGKYEAFRLRDTTA